MKLRLVLAILLICAPVWAQGGAVSTTVSSGSLVVAPVPSTPLRLVYDMSGLPLTILKDAAGTVAIDGLPYPGEVLYQPATGTIFYNHPEEPEWLSIPPTALEGLYSSNSTVVPGSKWQPWQNHPTQEWSVKSGTTTCDQWFSSTYAAQVSGLTVADIMRVLVGVQWLNGGGVADICEKIHITAEQGQKIGLPVLFTGPNGRWQLQEMVKEDVAKIEVPKANPVDDETRLRLLLVQFSPEDRADMLKKFAGQTTRQQIESISNLLNEDSNP